MEIDSERRRFLALAGTGTALSLAGCSALQNGNDDASANPDGADGGESSVAVAVQPDQETLQQRQQSIQSELQAGNIAQSEARQQAQTVQQELLSEAATSFEQHASSIDPLAIDDSVDQFGIFLVSGAASALIDALDVAAVNGLMPEDVFQQAASRANQSTATSTPSE